MCLGRDGSEREMMRFVSVEELCGRPELVAEGDLVLTSEGAPIAIVLGLHDEEDPAALERAIRRVRAEAALRRIQERARSVGLDSLTMEDIDAEIAASRAERQP
jgi:hypothetical protein